MAKLAEHTPGPWVAAYDDFGEEIWFGGSGCGTGIVGPAYLGGEGETQKGREHMQADARLISAAPEMLEALKAAIAGKDRWWCMVELAISKAEGREP